MQETRIYDKSDPKTKLDFKPANDEEKKHLRRLNELLCVKRKGDWLLVGQILSINAKNAENAFARVHSKRHLAVVHALESVIENRNNLLNQK